MACLLLPAILAAQTTAELTARLQTQTGLDRARTLAALTDALRQDNPKQALVYGEEALGLLLSTPIRKPTFSLSTRSPERT